MAIERARMTRRPGYVLAALLVIAGVGAAAHRPVAADVPVTRDEHMAMTLAAPERPGDGARGAAILAAARAVVERYRSSADAERDGYVKFLPNVPLPVEHFTNYRNAFAAAIGPFDPSRPTSVIYRRTARGLVAEGVMYTAPNRFDATQLDARVPLSYATWHRHVNLCWAPAGSTHDARFGFGGTIDTRAACDAAGGRFAPLAFNWMVHVWPLETVRAKIWAVDGDAEGSMHHHHGNGMVADQGALPIPLDRLPVVAVAAGDAAHGAAVFVANCASCHGAGGANGPDAPRLAGSGLAAGQVAYMIRHPQAIDTRSTMPLLGLSDGDVADVGTYVAEVAKRAP